jgi:benzoyl-CoA 2,3-dioxygenase component B
MRRVNNFDDWIDYFHYWQDSIGVAAKEFKGSAVSEEFRGKSFATFDFEAKFGEPEAETIEFGHYKGQSKWPTLMHIPDQRIRDALLNLIVYQGDTEFASVEQQRALLQNAPSDYDLFALMRVMSEEMRHGWQMSYLLCQHFGDEGRREAQKLLERRAEEGQRLLGSFNEIVENWLDFFTYTQFIDRDGKFQLKMLSTSAFHPLARSMGPMLKEESFHLGTGNNGLLRIVKAGKIPTEIMQRYFNKWIPTAFDLFGTDNSSSAHWAYVWGLKGRFNERETGDAADVAHLNEAGRELYRQEIVRLVARLNSAIPDREQHLYVPELQFNRKIGTWARKCYSVTGQEIDPAKYPAYIAGMTPTGEDREFLRGVFKENDWIEPKKAEDGN